MKVTKFAETGTCKYEMPYETGVTNTSWNVNQVIGSTIISRLSGEVLHQTHCAHQSTYNQLELGFSVVIHRNSVTGTRRMVTSNKQFETVKQMITDVLEFVPVKSLIDAKLVNIVFKK